MLAVLRTQGVDDLFAVTILMPDVPTAFDYVYGIWDIPVDYRDYRLPLFFRNADTLRRVPHIVLFYSHAYFPARVSSGLKRTRRVVMRPNTTSQGFATSHDCYRV